MELQDFLYEGLSHDVGAMLFSSDEFLHRDAHAHRNLGRGAHLVKWGPTKPDGKSELDMTAEYYRC